MDGKAVRLQPTQSKLIFLPLSRAQTGADARPASYTVCTTGGGGSSYRKRGQDIKLTFTPPSNAKFNIADIFIAVFT